MNRVLAEIVDAFEGECRIRLREIDEGDYRGFYLETISEAPTAFNEYGQAAEFGPVNTMTLVTPDELRDFCEQVSRALDPQATGSHSRLVRVDAALEAKK